MNLEEKIIKLFSGKNFTYKLYGKNKWIKLYEKSIKISVLEELCRLIPNSRVTQLKDSKDKYFKIEWK